MPSGVVDVKGLSPSSYFSEDAHLPNERQVGFWKPSDVPDHHGIGKSVAMSSPEKISVSEYQIVKSLDHPDSLLMLDKKVNVNSNRSAVGAERKARHTMTFLKHMEFDSGPRSSSTVQPGSYFGKSDEVNIMGGQYESSLFSSSMSELFTRKLRLSSGNTLYGHSVDTVASHYEEEEPFESLEELEAQTIGNLLPNDDDLLSGVTDRLDFVYHSTGGDDTEDLDFFSNIGGMDLGDDGLSDVQKNLESIRRVPNGQFGMNGSVVGEHPLGEHPSRTLFVRNINSNVEDSELRTLFEQYGDIRTLYTACKHRGFVMISYYDIRAARNAMKSLQNKPLRRRKLDIHYSIPKDNPTEKDVNQGNLVVFNLDSSVSNDELRQIFGAYGEIKELCETPHISQHKFVEYYDIRSAEAALCALNESDIAGKRIKVEPSRSGGLRPSLAQQLPPELEQVEFGLYLQQSSPPVSSTSGFSGTVPNGAILSSSIENRSVFGLHSGLRASSLDTALHHGISSSVPNNLSSLMRVESIRNQSVFMDSVHSASPIEYGNRGAPPPFHPHSLPEYHDSLSNNVHQNSPGAMPGNLRAPDRIDNRQLHGTSMNRHSIDLNEGVFGSAGTGPRPLPGHHYRWGNSFHPQSTGMVWPNSPTYVNGIHSAHPPPNLHGVPRGPSHLMHTVLPISKHHVESAPAVNPSLWDRQHGYAGELSEASGFHPGSLGSMKVSNNSPHSLDFVSHNFSHVGGNCVDLPIAQNNVGLQAHHQRCLMFPGRGQIPPLASSFDLNERARIRRNEVSSNQSENKKQYELDIDRIMRGDDTRTTLMIKNIPNKYTSKMLLAAIDERHRGTYDFIYLPIDFKNKCNVGYAFINMTEPTGIIPFYQAFNGKKWEKFNSEKVASLAYARIQGKAALIAHFQNSSLMNEDKRCRPILFNTDGPNAGDQVPFPVGVNVRARPGKARMNAHDHEESLGEYSGLREDFSNGDSSLGIAEDFEPDT